MKCNAIKDATKNDSRWGGRWEKDRERERAHKQKEQEEIDEASAGFVQLQIYKGHLYIVYMKCVHTSLQGLT